MSYFKAEMHKNRFLRSLAGFKGALLLREGKVRKRRRREGRGRKGRGGT